MSKRLTMVQSGTSASGKTKVWEVRSGALPLGVVAWYAPWRKYTFHPNEGTLFDQGCLAEVCDFLRTETQCHMAGV